MQASAPAPAALPRSTWIWAGALFALDAFMLGAPGLGFFIAAVRALWAGIKALVRKSRGAPGARVEALRCAIFAGAAALVIPVFLVQVKVGQDNAEKVIAALERHRAETGAYPVTLAALTPKYLAEIPPCAYRLLDNCQFKYTEDRQSGTHSLWWVAHPPYGRPTYDVEKRSWGYLD
jgi:hypothetical protein